MASFVVIDYESETKAEKVRLALLKMQKELWRLSRKPRGRKSSSCFRELSAYS
jgi:hypothetical protein